MARKGTRKKLVNPDDLAPGLAEGLTQGATKDDVAREALGGMTAAEAVMRPEDVPAEARTPRADRSYMNESALVEGTRVPRPSFVAEEDADSVWYDEPTGRAQKNVTMTFGKETVRAIQAGVICLRCLEPQSTSFPDLCESPPEMGCSYPIRDRQIIDFAMEFEGDKHLGPAKPVSEYMLEQEERREKREFEEKVAGHHHVIRNHR